MKAALACLLLTCTSAAYAAQSRTTTFAAPPVVAVGQPYYVDFADMLDLTAYKNIPFGPVTVSRFGSINFGNGDLAPYSYSITATAGSTATFTNRFTTTYLSGGTYSLSTSFLETLKIGTSSNSGSYTNLIGTVSVPAALNFKDVAQNRVTAVADAGSLTARFLPAAGIALASAARLASEWSGTLIDHFNWVQEITKITVPGLGSDSLGAPSSLVALAATRGSGLDPSLGGNPANRFKAAGLTTSDNLPFYYDEFKPASPFYDDHNLVSSNTSDIQLDFSDSPNQLFNGTQLEFSTILVGVTAYNQAVYFRGIDGLGFKWRYTEKSDPSAECIASPLNCNDLVFAGNAPSGSSELLGYLTASDYKVASDRAASYPAIAAVPEPATWAFMIVGFGSIGGAMRRRQRNVATTVR